MATRLSKLDSIFSAVAFAEAGEHQTALEIAGNAARPARRPGQLRSWLNRLEETFTAVAFAEAGMWEVAMEMAGSPAVRAPGATLQEFVSRVGLSGIPVYYGVART